MNDDVINLIEFYLLNKYDKCLKELLLRVSFYGDNLSFYRYTQEAEYGHPLLLYRTLNIYDENNDMIRKFIINKYYNNIRLPKRYTWSCGNFNNRGYKD